MCKRLHSHEHIQQFTPPCPPAAPLPQARCTGTSELQQISAAWDFADSSKDGTFNMRMWYNSTDRFGSGLTEIIRVNQGINLATNAYLRWALGEQYETVLVGIMNVPKVWGLDVGQ